MTNHESLVKKLCEFIGIEEVEFAEYVKTAKERVKKTRIKKKNGGHRHIVVPSWELKVIQYWVILYCLKDIEISQNATAFYKGANIKNNAVVHCKNNFFLKVDIKDFFPSITSAMLEESLENIFLDNVNQDAVLQLITALTNPAFKESLFHDDNCVIGYPVSPYIINIVMKGYDEKIVDSLKAIEASLGDFRYTRYADDMVVSYANKNSGKEVLKIIENCLRESFSNKLKLNSEKTKFTSRTGGSTLITGLRICSDGRITLHRKYKDDIRLKFSLYSKGVLDNEEIPSLLGHLNYCKFADPIFFNKLYSKYFSEIKKLKGIQEDLF